MRAPRNCPAGHLPSAAMAVVCFLLAAAHATAQDSAADRGSLAAVAHAYLSNRESFDAFSCDFVLTAGVADDLGAAKQGHLHDQLTAQGRWRVAGAKVRLELICDPAVIKERLKKGHVPFLSVAYVSNGQQQLLYTSLDQSGNVFPAEDQSKGIADSPFDMHIMGELESRNPARRIQDALAYNSFWQIKQGQGTSNKVVHVLLGDSPTKLSAAFELDGERGYLPLDFRAYGSDGKTVYAELFVTDMHDVGANRWFPYRSVLIWEPEKPAGPYKVRIWRVQKLDLHEPAEPEFETEVTKGSVLCNTSDPYSGFHISKTGHYGPNQIGNLLEQSYQAARENHPEAKPLAKGVTPSSPSAKGITSPPVGSVSSSRNMAILAVALILAAITFFVVRRLQSWLFRQK